LEGLKLYKAARRPAICSLRLPTSFSSTTVCLHASVDNAQVPRIQPFFTKGAKFEGFQSSPRCVKPNLSALYQYFCRSLRSLSSVKMFGKRSFASSKDRSGKISKQPKRSFARDASKQKHVIEKLEMRKDSPMMESPSLTSSIVTVVVGSDQRLFACHEDVLCHSPYFAQVLNAQFFNSANRRIDLPNEEPEIFSCILEYLYKGDYYPRLVQDKRRHTWMLEGAITSPEGDRAVAVEPTFFHAGVGDVLLRDTAIYCAADRYGLEELKKLSLRKQGLQSGIEVGTILRSARYAYENTPDSDSKLRAHYLVS
jgi:hypothetical protein